MKTPVKATDTGLICGRVKIASFKLDYSHLVQIIENLKCSTLESTKVADCLINYVSGNSLRASARMAEINEGTAVSWRQRDWFTEVCHAARSVAGQAADRKLSSILDLALKNTAERLEQGDAFKNGKEVSFKPVSAKDSALIAAIMYDKRALIRGENINVDSTTTLEDRLETLHEKFQKVASSSVVKLVQPKE